MSIRIQPSTPEQRREMYEDLLEVLTRGFLAQPVSIAGVPVSLRSLNSSDFYLARHRCGPDHTFAQWNEWLLASAIWMFDGQILLEDPHAAFEVYRICKQLPMQAKLIFLSVMKILMVRANKAINITEAFCYERESRMLWRSFGHDVVEKSGIPGASRLGLSTAHRIWCSFNEMEDDREQWLADWTRTKLIASTQAPKGIKRLNAADTQSVETEERRRQAVMDKAYYLMVKGIDLKLPMGHGGRYQDIRVAVTPEELEEEMRKVRTGEKDQHDLVVDFYKRKVRERVEKERASRARRIAETEHALAAAGIKEPLRPSLIGADEVAEQMNCRQGLKRVVYGEGRNRNYDRYLKKDPVVGTVRTSKQGVPIALPKDGPSLNDQLRSRKPQLGGN